MPQVGAPDVGQAPLIEDSMEAYPHDEWRSGSTRYAPAPQAYYQETVLACHREC